MCPCRRARLFSLKHCSSPSEFSASRDSMAALRAPMECQTPLAEMSELQLQSFATLLRGQGLLAVALTDWSGQGVGRRRYTCGTNMPPMLLEPAFRSPQKQSRLCGGEGNPWTMLRPSEECLGPCPSSTQTSVICMCRGLGYAAGRDDVLGLASGCIAK